MEVWNEYKTYCSFSGKPNVADYFFKWIHDNSANEKIVKKLEITKSYEGAFAYEILVGIPCLNGFDRGDQKFLALAMTYPDTATLHNATDSDWYDFEDCISKIQGVKLNQLCPQLFKTNNRN